MYVCMYHVQVYSIICVRTDVFMYECMYAYNCVHMNVYTRVSIYVRTCVCMYACMHVWLKLPKTSPVGFLNGENYIAIYLKIFVSM